MAISAAQAAKLVSSQNSSQRRDSDDESVVDKIKDYFGNFKKDIKDGLEEIKQILNYEKLSDENKKIANDIISEVKQNRENLSKKMDTEPLARKFSSIWSSGIFTSTFSKVYENTIGKAKSFLAIKKSLGDVNKNISSLGKRIFDFSVIISNPVRWLRNVVIDLKNSIISGFQSALNFALGGVFKILGNILRFSRMVLFMVIKAMAFMALKLVVLSVKLISFLTIKFFVLTLFLIKMSLMIIPMLFTIFVAAIKIGIAVGLVLIKVIAIALAAAVIVGVVLLIAFGLYKFFKWIFGMEWVEKIVDGVKFVFNWIQEKVMGFVDWMLGFEWVTNLVDAFTEGMTALFTGTLNLTNIVLNAIGNFFGLPDGFFQGVFMNVINWFSDFFIGVGQLIYDLFWGEGTFWERIVDVILMPALEAWSKLWDWATNLFSNMSEWLASQGWFQTIVGAIDWVIEGLRPAWEWAYDNVISPIMDFLSSLLDKVINFLPNIIKEGFLRIPKMILSALGGFFREEIDDAVGESQDRRLTAATADIDSQLDNITPRMQELDDTIYSGLPEGLMVDDLMNVSKEEGVRILVSKGKTEQEAKILMEEIEEWQELRRENVRLQGMKLDILRDEETSTSGFLKDVGAGVSGGAKAFWRKATGLVGLATGGVVTNQTLAMIAEASRPEVVIPLDDRGLDFGRRLFTENDSLSTGQMNDEKTIQIMNSVESAMVHTVNNNTQFIDALGKKLTEVFQNDTSRLPKDFDGSTDQKKLNMGNISSSDPKSEMARFIAMGFIGPKRF